MQLISVNVTLNPLATVFAITSPTAVQTAILFPKRKHWKEPSVYIQVLTVNVFMCFIVIAGIFTVQFLNGEKN